MLETIALDFTKERSLRTIKIPDTEGSLHNFEEMTSGAGAHLDSYSDDPSIICMHFLHPSITPRAIRKLGIPTLQDRFLERMAGAEFIQDFEQEEDFMTLIDDTLRRYPLATTFREYLANAEDCGTATKISWVSDTTPAYPKMSLITNRLADCHGPALLCYNDGVFTEKDFSAVIKIGIGSKRDEPSKIGRFGRGSLTMYHWTMCPCFVSGQYFVIFDPQQKRLPKNPQTGKRRKGMKLALKDVRMNWPDQLKPFEGLFGFTSESEFFHGTLFRFPVMDTKPKTLIHSLLGSVMDTKLKTSIHPLYDPALALGKYRLEGDAYCSLIFLRNINSIECFKRDLNRGVAQEPDWSISRSIYDTCHSGPYTIEGIGFEFLSAAMPAIPTNFEKRWVVVRFEIPGGSIPDGVRNTQKDERLQASCAVASPISLGKPKIGTGRLFLTLPTENVLDLPVFISADLVIQSDRRGLPLHDEHGAEWNYWILEYGVAEAYIKLLHHLTRNPGSDPTHIWPKYHSKPSTLHSKSPIDDIISNALWKKVILDGNYSGDIFRAHSSVDGISVVSPSRSCFNLLDGPIRGLMDELLPIIIPDDNDWELVSSEGDLLSSLRELTQSHGTTAVRTITPTLVLDLLRDRSDCSRPLRDIWGDRYGLKLGFLNTLLEFLSQGGANAMRMIGCNILPLANCDLGKLGKKGGSDFLLPPNSGGIMDGQLLNVLPEFLDRKSVV